MVFPETAAFLGISPYFFYLIILMFAMGAFSGLMIASNASLIVGLSARCGCRRQPLFLEQHDGTNRLGSGF